MRLITVVTAILVSTIVAAQGKTEPSIEYSFAPAKMEETDVREMANHIRKSINLQCEFVKFDATSLVDLVKKIEDSDLSVGETSIVVRFLDGSWMKYVGLTSEVKQSQSRLGPYVWEGAADQNDSFATFVVQSESHTIAYISKAGVMYKLDSSFSSEGHFLCMRDPDFRGKKID